MLKHRESYAFFREPPSLFNVAAELVAAFEPGFRVVFADKNENEPDDSGQYAVFEPEAEGRAVLERPSWPIATFWLAQPVSSAEPRVYLSSMEGKWWRDSFLSIDFRDISNALWAHGRGGPTKEQQRAAYETAATLHRALVGRCGALLSYTSSTNNDTPAGVAPIEQAAQVLEALEASDSEKLYAAFSHNEMPFVWLLAVDPTLPFAAPLADQFLRDSNLVVERSERVLIMEDKGFRPYGLRWEEEAEETTAA